MTPQVIQCFIYSIFSCFRHLLPCFSRIVVAWHGQHSPVQALQQLLHGRIHCQKLQGLGYALCKMSCNILTFVDSPMCNNCTVRVYQPNATNIHAKCTNPAIMSNPVASKASPKSSRHFGCKRAQYRNSKAWCKPSGLKPCSLTALGDSMLTKFNNNLWGQQLMMYEY